MGNFFPFKNGALIVHLFIFFMQKKLDFAFYVIFLGDTILVNLCIAQCCEKGQVVAHLIPAQLSITYILLKSMLSKIIFFNLQASTLV